MKTYAFIFARGGSKGLPQKNIKMLGGMPLLAHAIRLAQALPVVEKVFVSTDDEAIAKVAQDFSAELIERPAALAQDHAPEWLAWQHAIKVLYERGERFEVFLSLPTTSPLRRQEDVSGCLALLDKESDLVLAVTPSARSPYFNMVSRGQDGETELLIKDSKINRRQDAPASYDITTVAYVSRPAFILQHQSMFEGRLRSFIVPRERALDIDDPYDFKIAQALYRQGEPCSL